MFLLPAGVRLQLWSRCAAPSSRHLVKVPCSTGSRLHVRKSHATGDVREQDGFWSKNSIAPGGADEDLPKISDLTSSSPKALDQQKQATPAAETSGLAALAASMYSSAEESSTRKRRLRRPSHAATVTHAVPDSSPAEIEDPNAASEPGLPRPDKDISAAPSPDQPEWHEILVPSSSGSAQIQRMNLQYILDHVALPRREQYPKAHRDLFKITTMEHAIHGAIRAHLKRTTHAHLKPKIQFRASEDLPQDVRNHIDLGSWACAVNVDVPQLLKCDAVAHGRSKQSAKTAAWALIVARLHSQNDLRKLFPDSKVDWCRPDRSDHRDEATKLGIPPVERKSPVKDLSQEELPPKGSSAQDLPTEVPTLESAEKAAKASDEMKGHIDMRYDLRYIKKHMRLPAREHYPVLNNVFHIVDETTREVPTNLAAACKALCNKEKYSVELDMGQREKGGISMKTCELKLTIPGHGKYVSFGVDESKNGKRAVAAAWLGTISQLHTSGFLRGLETRLASETYATKNIHDLATADRVLPTPEEYPMAPESLFRPAKIMSTILGACRKAGLHLDMKYDSTPLDGHCMPGSTPTGMTLQVKLPHFSGETYVAAMHTTIAKRGVWVEMLSKLHTSGVLRQLFPADFQDTPKHDAMVSPDRLAGTARSASNAADATAADEDLEMSEVEAETLAKEKDAKVDIYNFAARLGVTPLFEVKVMSLGRQNRRKNKSTNAVKVSIRLPALNLEASALSKDFHRAEVAACIAFKQKAEHVEVIREAEGRPLNPHHDLLTVENAVQFFDLYRKSRRGLSIKVENKHVVVANADTHQACILIDDRPFGKPVAMTTKKAAESLAYLVAAIEVVREQPDFLAEFAQAMRAGRGKILRDVRPVALTLDHVTLDEMRVSLVAARLAGLPDEHSTLNAEGDLRYGRTSRRTAFDDSQLQAISQSLLKAHEHYESDQTLSAIRQTKADLPMSQHSAQVLGLLSGGVYSIIIGATGSGKTTQVPQIILEDAIRKEQGGFCNIVCTQPRRLAASSVARRVSAELGEHLGHKVGYHVRGEASLPSAGGSITYCTTGILLQQLKFDADAVMERMSHLIIDEVHERDMGIDFLLIILKKAVKSRLAAGKTVPQVVLMSATLDPELFADYLAEDNSKCPVLSVPGRTFPVKETYLNEILHDLRQQDEHELERLINMDGAVSSDYLASERSFSASVTGSAIDSSPVIDWKGKRNQTSDQEGHSVAREKEEALVPLPLVGAAVAHIARTTSDGAILVFLPGLQEITGTQDILTKGRPFGIDFSDTEKFKICLLHSAVPPAEQKEVLDQPRPGCRKIILSTNIAETSVTVPDVKHVVDAGKLREKRYDQVTRITKLQCTWASNSNVRQRAGRAGRVQEGFYYGLYSKERRQKMTASGLPEILRTDLQETCLSIKAQGFEEPVASFLSQAIEPPSAAAVKTAVENLQAIEAFTSEQELTALGRVLSTLPVHPALGKTILLGIVFRCLDPMLVLSAMGSERPLFVDPVSGRWMARDAQKKYTSDDSDHLALYHAFTDLRSVHSRAGERGAYDHAMRNFLHLGAFKNITQVARQIEQVLLEHGLLPEIGCREVSSLQYGGHLFNQNSNNSALVKGLLIAGFQPNLGVRRPGSRSTTFRTPMENEVRIHPGSHNNKKSWPAEEDVIYTYSVLTKSVNNESLFMRDTTLVTPLMVLLFGGRLQMNGRLTMDDWLPFDVRATHRNYAVRLVLEYRKALDRMLNSAFKSLSNAGRGNSMADDAVIEHFANNVAKLLESSSSREKRQQQQQQELQQRMQDWIPSAWWPRQQQPQGSEP